MSTHQAALEWNRRPHRTEVGTYSRNHAVFLNGDQQVTMSASVDYKGDAAAADPEQMLISALASCHMLFFLAIAEAKGYCVESYVDQAVGHLEKGPEGMSITKIELFPKVTFTGARIPDEGAIEAIHAGAHKSCFIGKSIKAKVDVHAAADQALSA